MEIMSIKEYERRILVSTIPPPLVCCAECQNVEVEEDGMICAGCFLDSRNPDWNMPAVIDPVRADAWRELDAIKARLRKERLEAIERAFVAAIEARELDVLLAVAG